MFSHLLFPYDPVEYSPPSMPRSSRVVYHPKLCPTRFILLVLITLRIPGEEQKSQSSSLWNFTVIPVTSPFFRPNILLGNFVLKHNKSLFFPRNEKPSIKTVSNNITL
jgi:hypothetical protein